MTPQEAINAANAALAAYNAAYKAATATADAAYDAAYEAYNAEMDRICKEYPL